MYGLVQKDLRLTNLGVDQTITANRIATNIIESKSLITNSIETTNMTITGILDFDGALGFDSLTLTAIVNQLTLGTGSTITLSAPTPATSVTYTIPDVGANASFVLTEGNQTINGVKSFTSPLSLASLTLTDTTNQLVLGTTNTTTINSVAPAAPRVYTIPDAGGAASFVMTAGNQTIGGTKTFSVAPILTGLALAFASLTLTATTNQLVLGTTNTTTITSPAPAASRTHTIPILTANASFVMTEGTQTINGTKTFTDLIQFDNGIRFGPAGNTILNGYTDDAVTVNMTGGFNVSQSVQIRGQLIDNEFVMLTFRPITAAAAGAASNITSSDVLLPFNPSQTRTFTIPVINNSVNTLGFMTITSASVITIQRFDFTTGAPTTFGNAGNNGFPSFSVTYCKSSL
jgi:hypothetical protein